MQKGSGYISNFSANATGLYQRQNQMTKTALFCMSIMHAFNNLGRLAQDNIPQLANQFSNLYGPQDQQARSRGLVASAIPEIQNTCCGAVGIPALLLIGVWIGFSGTIFSDVTS